MPKIAAVSVYVDNMDRAVDFYTKWLGFKVEAKPNPYITVLEHEGVALVLCQAETARKLAYTKEAGTVLGLASQKLEKEIARLQAAKVEFVVATPQDMPGGRFVAVRDPSGNVIELLEFEGT